MTCLGCERIAVSPVVLDTGEAVCSYCEAWKEECFKRHRHIENMFKLDRVGRNTYIDSLVQSEGQVSADRTKTGFLTEWEARKRKAESDL
jgi:hypothetical protein